MVPRSPVQGLRSLPANGPLSNRFYTFIWCWNHSQLLKCVFNQKQNDRKCPTLCTSFLITCPNKTPLQGVRPMCKQHTTKACKRNGRKASKIRTLCGLDSQLGWSIGYTRCNSDATNETFRETGIQYLSTELEEQQLLWSRHAKRMIGTRIPRRALE
jgi:hypothetical protein